jgi:hypothetical protein
MIGPFVHANASVLISTAQPRANNAISLDAKVFQVCCWWGIGLILEEDKKLRWIGGSIASVTVNEP